MSNKEIDVDKLESTSLCCRGTWPDGETDWIFCRIYTVCVHEDYVLDIYNTWCEIIHINTDFIKTVVLFLDIYT